MGCARSKAKLCTREQIAELCSTAAKEMMVVCAKSAVLHSDDIVIVAPPEITVNLKRHIFSMRAYIEAAIASEEEAMRAFRRDARASTWDACATVGLDSVTFSSHGSVNDLEQPIEGEAVQVQATLDTNSRSLAGWQGAKSDPLPNGKAKAKPKAKKNAAKAKAKRRISLGTSSRGLQDPTKSTGFDNIRAESAQPLLLPETDSLMVLDGDDVSNVLARVADMLEALVAELQTAFRASEVGKDCVQDNSAQVLKLLNTCIVQMAFSEEAVIEIVRGAEPYGKAELAAVPLDAVSQYFCAQCCAGLVDKLLPLCEESIRAYDVISSWKNGMEKFSRLSEQVDKLGIDLKLSPIELDINNYIVAQTIEQLGVLMGREEVAKRFGAVGVQGFFPETDMPSGGSNDPKVFEEMFGGSVLDEAVYAKIVATTE